MNKFITLIACFGLLSQSFGQIVNIPDPAFKSALVSNSDINTNLDSEIQGTEALGFTDSIMVSSSSITDLTGIEEFVNIIYLSASNNLLTGTIDLSTNVDLKQIWLSNNAIDSIILPATTQLQYLVAQYNSISSLDISNNPNLTTLLCRNNPLTSIDAGNNPVLGNVELQNCSLATLDFSSSNNLQFLHAENNLLTSLTLPTSNDLFQLYVDNNQLTSLDCSVNTNLNYLYCSNNNLTNLILPTSSTFMSVLNCSYNNLTCLDFSTLTNLFIINCSNNNLSGINAQNTNNSSISNPNFNALNNPSLTCIQVDNVTYSISTWTNIDTAASFSLSCGTPVANFTDDHNECFGAAINFTDLSTGAQTWYWDFDNGNTSTVQNPVYTYPAAGLYFPQLTVTNCFSSHSYSNAIEVGRNMHFVIFSPSITINTGSAVLYKYQPIFTSFDTVQVFYFISPSVSFFNVASGDYMIKVTPDPVLNPGVLPTYYTSSWSWDSASVFTHDCLADTTFTINMLEQTAITTGPGFLHGTIIEGAGFGRAQGDPIHGVDVKLGITGSSAIVANTETDVNGEYTFSGIPNGNYTIYADIPGLLKDSSYTITLDSVNNQFLTLDYMVDSSSIYIIENTGIEEEPPLDLIIAPNPNINGFYISGYNLMTDALLTIYDISGKMVICQKINSVGQYIEVPLEPGTYFIQLNTETHIYRQKLIRR